MAKRVCIGLDIGSSAVRAAEVVIDGERSVLRRFAQVGLPAGAVVEGEIQDPAAVTVALKSLWQHGGFAGKKVVLGLGSQRAMVRQVEMPPMADSELRSALKFKIGEFLPIPVEQAVVDFAPLPAGGGGGDTRRVLLVAAQREVVLDEVAAVEAAGLTVVAVDPSSLALLRAVARREPPLDGDGSDAGLEAVVGIGAELVTVAVREGGVPRFVRTVALTDPSVAQGPSERAPGSAPTDRFKQGGPKAANVGVALDSAPRIEAIVNEVRSSIEYLLSQSGTGHLERVLLTGGGALLPGVTAALSSAVALPVTIADARLQVDKKSVGLEGSALEEASYRWLTAVGLAVWGQGSYDKCSLLPPEVIAKRRQHRAMVGAAATIVVVAGSLGALSYGRVHSADSISSEIRSSEAAATVMQQKSHRLGYVLEVPTEIQTRRDVAQTALYGDINWIGMLHRIEAATPSDVSPQTLTLTKGEEAAALSGASQVPAGSIIGTLTMSAQTRGGARAVAQFIDQVSVVKGIYALWVSSTTNAARETTISATAELTTGALSTRAAALPGGDS